MKSGRRVPDTHAVTECHAPPSPSCGHRVQLRLGEGEAAADVLILGLSFSPSVRPPTRGSGLLRGVGADHRQRPRQVPAGEVGEGRPVLVGQAGDLERVAA